MSSVANCVAGEADVATHAHAFRLHEGGEGAADLVDEIFVDLVGNAAADVVGLERGEIDHFRSFLSRGCACDDVFQAACGLDARHELLHVLHLGLGRHQHRIGGFDDDHVMQTQRGHEAAVGVHVAAVGIFQQHIAANDVAVLSAGSTSCSAAQEPTSFQPASSGTMTASRVFSMTA